MKIRVAFCSMIIVAGLILGLTTAASAGYPDRPIQVIVGFKAGGGVDTMARLLCQKAGDILGQPMVVLNRAGAGGAVAAMALKSAKPDGYTLCFNIALVFAGWPYFTKVEYTKDDFTYIAAVGKFQEAFVSLPDKPWKTWPELIAHAKKNGSLNVAVMTPYDKSVLRYIGKKEGVEFNMVPTKGGAEIMTQVLGGHVDFGFSGGIHYSYVKAGKMIVLAGHGQDRLEATPEVPTLKELGYNIALDNYELIVGPKALPAEVLARLDAAFRQAVQDPDYQDLLKNKLFFPAVYLDSAALTTRINDMDKEFKEMAEFIK